MLNIYKTVDEQCGFEEVSEFSKGCWISLVNPTEEELSFVGKGLNVNLDYLKHPLDEEERPRIDMEENQTLIILDIPVVEDDEGLTNHITIPLGMVVIGDDYFVTICLKENPIIDLFRDKKIRSFFTFKKTRFILQILQKTAEFYLKYLGAINRETDNVEDELQVSMKNKEVIRLLGLEKSLVYFTTSLKANEIVMEKLLKGKYIKMYEEDEDILEDAIVENKQAIEMARTYSDILSGMMDAFASLISNNLNIVMKFLTSVTIVVALPTMVASFYGMNVALPFQGTWFAFSYVLGISLLISIIAVIMLRKRNMF